MPLSPSDGPIKALPHSTYAVLAGLVLVALILAALADQPAATFAAHLSAATVRTGLRISDVGLSGYMFAVSAIVAIGAALARRSAWGRQRFVTLTLLAERAVYFFAAIGASGLAVQALKHLIGRVRPKVAPDAGVFNFHPFSLKNSFASFPSGHTTSIFAAAMALGLMLPRLRWLFYTVAVAVGLARIVVGDHYPSDVVGGAALGSLVAFELARLCASRGFAFRPLESFARRPGEKPTLGTG